MIGVGGGIFLSPVVLLRHWATPKAAAATAAAFIWLNSAAGLAGAGLSGQLQIELEILLDKELLKRQQRLENLELVGKIGM